MALVLDEVVVEVSDISDGVSLQLSAAIQGVGGIDGLANLAKTDLSNVSAADLSELIQSFSPTEVAALQSLVGIASGGGVALDFSNTTQSSRLALFDMMKADGLFVGLLGVEAG